MAVIYSYPTKTNPAGSDLILISDSADSNKTKQVKVSSLPSSGGGSVSSVELSLSGIAAFAITGDNPITSSGTIILGTTGGSAGQFLDYQGNWSTPAGVSSVTSANTAITVADSTTAPVLTSVAYSGGNNIGHVPTGGSGTTYLKGDGTWDTPSGSGGSYTAGDGLQLNGTVFSTDLKENGGLVIESNELALDLAASSITGTLATSDGGTGSSNTEYCDLTANVTGTLPVGKGGTGVTTLGASRLILGNGINAVTSISSQTKGTLVVGNDTTTTTLAVGTTNGHVLTIDSGEATGVRWTAIPTTNLVTGITGTLPVGNGGTGITTAVAGTITRGNGTNGLTADTDLQYDGTQKSLKIRGTGNTAPTMSAPLSINDVQGSANIYEACIGLTPYKAAQGGKAISIGLDGYRDGIIVVRKNANSGAAMIFHQVVNANAQVGSITFDNSATAYNTTSDYRLKENVVEMTGSVDRVKQLKPSRFNFISEPDTKIVDGFLAHEVSSVVPEAIHGEKDAVDDQGNIIYQGIDQSKLVPLLVGAIKELTARIEALEA